MVKDLNIYRTNTVLITCHKYVLLSISNSRGYRNLLFFQSLRGKTDHMLPL